jgi:hypothetical protein
MVHQNILTLLDEAAAQCTVQSCLQVLICTKRYISLLFEESFDPLILPIIPGVINQLIRYAIIIITLCSILPAVAHDIPYVPSIC